VKETSLTTPRIVVVVVVAARSLYARERVNGPPVAGIVDTTTDDVNTVFAATVPEPPSVNVIVCVDES